MPTGTAWPPTLPQSFLVSGLKIDEVDNVVRTQTDAGTYKTFLRGTKRKWIVRGNMLMSMQQFDEFDLFYTTKLAQGALPFDWLHPVLGIRTRCFLAEPPKVSSVESKDHVMVQLTVRMEED